MKKELGHTAFIRILDASICITNTECDTLVRGHIGMGTHEYRQRAHDHIIT